MHTHKYEQRTCYLQLHTAVQLNCLQKLAPLNPPDVYYFLQTVYCTTPPFTIPVHSHNIVHRMAQHGYGMIILEVPPSKKFKT